MSASFERGQITGIVGRNGSGKSVLLKIICGLLKPDSGELIIDGAKITGVLNGLRKKDRTIIITSHNSDDINILCDKVYTMEEGKLYGEE